MRKAALKGSVQVMSDPDGFNAIDDRIIVFTVGPFAYFWFRINKGPTPIAIISDSLNSRYEDLPLMKAHSDLLSKYGSDPM